MDNREEDVIALDYTLDEDLWIYDKFILAKKLGYICGPKGMDVPKHQKYIIRPTINFCGMGDGAKFAILKKYTYNIPDGFFWCEIFKGRHLSIDYHNKKQVLCVEGFKEDKNNLQRWDKWVKVPDQVPFPKILKKLKGNYEWINIEMIDRKIIEVHLRKNPDFEYHNSNYIIPVWLGQKPKLKKGQKFIKENIETRLGYIIEDK